MGQPRPAPLRLTLVRHAATTWNEGGRWQGLTDNPLGLTGETQARALGSRLCPPYSRVFSSPLLRAVQTADLALPGSSVILDERLREYDLGELEGMTVAEMRGHPGFAHWQTDPWNHPAPGGESLSAVAARMRTWAEELPEGEHVIAFSHSIAIRSLLVDLFGLPLEPQENYAVPFRERLGHTETVELERQQGVWRRVGADEDQRASSPKAEGQPKTSLDLLQCRVAQR